MQAAVRLLSRREHSRVELERKLTAYDAQAVRQALARLTEQGLQSDDRFAEQYVRMRMEKGYGPLRIRAELREKGIADELIDSWLDDAHLDWRSRMLGVAQKKYGDTPPQSQNELAKRSRFLAQRGFPPSLVREYLLEDT